MADTVSVNITIDDFTFSLGPDLAICEGISGVFRWYNVSWRQH